MRRRNSFVLALGLLAAAGCAQNSTETQLDEKLAHETAVKNRADLDKEADQLLKNSPSLDDRQKKELADLRKSVKGESDLLIQKSLKLRALLIQQLMSRRFDEATLERTESDLKSVEDDRLILFFKAVHAANHVMGRFGSRAERQEREAEEYEDQIQILMNELYR